jgi:hypothetical protein
LIQHRLTKDIAVIDCAIIRLKIEGRISYERGLDDNGDRLVLLSQYDEDPVARMIGVKVLESMEDRICRRLAEVLGGVETGHRSLFIESVGSRG